MSKNKILDGDECERLFCEHCLSPLQRDEVRYCKKCLETFQISKHYLDKVKALSIIRVCANCGKTLETTTSDMNRFCCQECARDYNRNPEDRVQRVTKICALCGSEYKTDPNDPYYFESSYCSVTCEYYVKYNNYFVTNDLMNLYGRTRGLRNFIRGFTRRSKYRIDITPVTEQHPCLNCGAPSSNELIYFCSEKCHKEFISEPLLYRNFNITRTCPICHKTYDLTIQDLIYGKYTCGSEGCFDKHRRWNRKIYHNTCIVCDLKYRSNDQELVCSDQCAEQLSLWIEGKKINKIVTGETKKERLMRILGLHQNEPIIYDDDQILNCNVKLESNIKLESDVNSKQ